MKTIRRFPRTVTETPNLFIPLRDGTRLATRAWMPADALKKPVPVILEYLPYRKRDGTIVRDALTHPYLAGHGYACLRVDMRGCGESEGTPGHVLCTDQVEDVRNAISYLAQRPEVMADRIALSGTSFGGAVVLYTAGVDTRVAAVISDWVKAIWLQTTAWPSMRESTMGLSVSPSSAWDVGHALLAQSFWSHPRPRTTATSGWSATYWRTRSTHSAQLRVPTKSTVSRAWPSARKWAWASMKPG